MASRPRLNIFVTGAAGGIGLAVIQQLASRYDGHFVLTDIDAQKLRVMKDRFERTDLMITPIVLDVRDQAAICEVMRIFEPKGEALDLLLNNAGVMTGAGNFEDNSLTEIERSIDINLKAVIWATHCAWPYLLNAKGCVINMSSGAGKIGLISDPVYAAGKAGVVMFTKSCAMRSPQTGIRFNAILPGIVDTGILIDPITGDRRDEVKGFMTQYSLIAPDEIATIVLRLLSDSACNDEAIVVPNRKREKGAS